MLYNSEMRLSEKTLASLTNVLKLQTSLSELYFAVSHWELGKNRPRATQVAAISALTKLGKRKVEALLEEKAPEEFAALKKAAEKKAAKKAAKAAKAPKAAKA